MAVSVRHDCQLRFDYIRGKDMLFMLSSCQKVISSTLRLWRTRFKLIKQLILSPTLLVINDIHLAFKQLMKIHMGKTLSDIRR